MFPGSLLQSPAYCYTAGLGFVSFILFYIRWYFDLWCDSPSWESRINWPDEQAKAIKDGRAGHHPEGREWKDFATMMEDINASNAIDPSDMWSPFKYGFKNFRWTIRFFLPANVDKDRMLQLCARDDESMNQVTKDDGKHYMHWA